jgi:COMM domain containing 8
LNAAIDRIYKSETPLKLRKHSAELDYIGNIFTQYCSNQLTKAELLEHFPVTDELKDCVFKTIEVRKPQVSNHLVNIHNSSSIPLMKSFDWDLKFIIGNSSLASFREQKATLMLNCQKGKKPETISVELNRAMVEKMILEIENS